MVERREKSPTTQHDEETRLQINTKEREKKEKIEYLLHFVKKKK